MKRASLFAFVLAVLVYALVRYALEELRELRDSVQSEEQRGDKFNRRLYELENERAERAARTA